MKIQDPVLVVDVSRWQYRVNGKELKDGGVEGIIVKMSSGLSKDPRFEKHAEEAVKNDLVLMVYHWDDIIYNPEQQAEFVLQTIQENAFPVKFVWGDQEQWWLDWNLWLKARSGSLPYSSVPRLSSDNIAKHNEDFMKALNTLIKPSGVYTSYGFTSSFAPKMADYIGMYKTWVAHYGRIIPSISLSWEDLRNTYMPSYNILLPLGAQEKNVVGHQFSGDSLKLPGMYDAIGRRTGADVNVFSRNFFDMITGKIPWDYAEEKPEEKPEEIYTPVEYQTLVENLNVRRDATIDSPVLRVLQGKGTKIMVLFVSGNWAKLEGQGWVSFKYIKEANAVEEEKPEENLEVKLYETTVRYLNVRKCNSVTCSIIRTISGVGSVVAVIDFDDGWARLEDGGWISNKYIVPHVVENGRAYQTVVNNLNVRKDASIYSPVLRVLQGIYTPISVVGFSGNWARLEDGGWVYSRYISPCP